MKRILTFLFLLSIIYNVVAQQPGRRVSRYGFEVYYRPPVYYDFYLSFNSNERASHMNFDLRLQNDLLRFTNVSDGYEANYEVSIIIKKANSESAVFADAWRKKVVVQEFEQTNSKKVYQVDKKIFSIDLAPGAYRLFLELMDSGTGKGYRNSREFNIIPDYKYTEIKLFKVADDQSGEIILGPEPPLVEFNYDQKVSFEFKTPVRDSLVITSKLLSVKDENSPIIRQRIQRIFADTSNILFSERIEQKYLKEGRYLLKYRIKYQQEVTNLEKYFTVVWFEKPVYLYKHDLALRPMIYLLSPEEFDTADGLSYDELGEWMEEYWLAKDPTPESPLNEIQVEYFNRVDQANREYSQRFTEGWETDRGKALILYGEPDRKESNRYAINSKPYEIWYYNSLKRKLTFVDKYKEENYVLVSVEEFKEGNNE